MVRPIPIETEEELQWIKEFMLLPVLLDVLERDMKLFKTMPLKMPEVYIQILHRVQDQAMIDLVEIRRQLKAHGMRVYDQKRTHLGMNAEYLCRGYHHRFSMLWNVVKAEIEQRLRAYLQMKLIHLT